MLSQVAPGSPYIVFKVDANGAQRMLEDLWDMVEFCRLMVGDASQWESTFVCGLKGSLQASKKRPNMA